MSIADCYNRNLPEAQELEKKYGRVKTNLLYHANNHTLPTIQEAEKLLAGKSEKYSDIKLVEPVWEDMAGKSYAEIAARKSELQAQGAQITNLGANGFNYVIPERNINYQLTDNKTLKNELQAIISKAIQGGPTEGNIGTALSIFGTSKGTINQSTGERQDIQSLWEQIQERGLEYRGSELTAKNYLNEGAEHIAYKEGSVVIKERYNSPLETMDSYLRQLLVYNKLFPETAYKLLGFKKVGEHPDPSSEQAVFYASYKGNISPVLQQQFINDDEDSYKDINDYFAVKNVLGLLGYKESEDQSEFSNADDSIVIKDISPRNVFINKGVPAFIDPILVIDDSILYGQPEPVDTNTLPDEQLNQILKDYAEKELGGKVNMTDQIVVDGKVISANAVTDVVKRTIDLANGKVKIDTLPEEVAHIYVHWLPKNSLLLRDMLTDIRLRPIYDAVIEEYKDNVHYQHPDGTVDEYKMALEAIGKQIAGTIVGQYTDKKSKSLLQKLIDWVTGIFKGKTLDSYEQVAQNILNKDTSDLDLRTLKDIRYDIQSSIFQAVEGRQQKNTIQTAITNFRGLETSFRNDTEDGPTVADYWKRIQEAGLEYKEGGLDKLYTSGQEHLVYKTDRGTMLKVNRSWEPTQLSPYLRMLIAYNKMFPETAYTLKGFIKEGNLIFPVVEQPTIISDDSYNPETIVNALAKLGFKEQRDNPLVFDSEVLSSSIKDLSPRNVFFKEGVPYFIDPMLTIDNSLLYPRPEWETGIVDPGSNYMFQLSKDQDSLVKHYTKKYGKKDIRVQVMNNLYVNPHSHLKLVEEDETGPVHYYIDTVTGQKFLSVTTAVGGEWTDEQREEYAINTRWGNQVDGLLQDIILGTTPRNTPDLSEAVRFKLYGILSRIVGEETADGSILLPQAIMADPESGIAGSIDILVVHPDGTQKIIDMKSSWSSVEDRKYTTTTYERGAGAKVQQALTKEQQHNIQVQCYSKLAWLMGFKDVPAYTRHIYLNAANGVVRDVEDEGEYAHLPTAYQTMVDTIIPTKYQGKDRIEELNESNDTGNPTHAKTFIESVTPQQKIVSILEAATTYQKTIEETRNMVGFRPRAQTLEKIVELIAGIDEAIAEAQKTAHQKGKKPDYHKAFAAFIEYASEELGKIMEYLGNEKHFSSPEYIRIARLARNYVDTFQGVMGTEKFAKGTYLEPMLYNLQTDLQATIDAIDGAFSRSVDNQVLPLSTNENVQDIINKDISITSTFFGDISNSGNPLLENIDKKVKIGHEVSRENTENIVQQIQDAANKLVKIAGKKSSDIYDIFFQRDANGKKTGRMISMLGNIYWQLRNEVDTPLYNNDGSYKEYVMNADTNEQKDYNKNLYVLKEARRKFVQAEKTGVDANNKIYAEDGDYHKLTDTFKEERSKWMRQNKYGYWELIKEDKASLAWRGANYDYMKYYSMKKDKKGNPTGVVEEKWGYLFPKDMHVVAREYASDGTDMVDPQYAALFRAGNKTPLQKAQAEYYDAYKKIMLTQVEKLPPSAMVWFNRGYIPTLRANFFRLLASKDSSVTEIVAAEMRDFFSTVAYTNQTAVTASGSPSQSLPILYMGKLQDQDRLNRLQKQVEEYAQKRGTIPVKEWQKEYKRLKELLKQEQSRTQADQISPDLTEGLVAFAGMAENFHIMSGVEDQVQAVKQVLSEMEFEQKNKKVAGKDSNAYRRFSEWMEMAFYYDPNHNRDTADVIGKRLKGITSIMSIPFNILGGINNAVIASINNNLDSWGSDFYDFRAITRMSKLFITEALPGYVQTLSEYTLAKKDQYTKRKAGSKYDALAMKFNMVEHYQEGQGKTDILAAIGGYSIIEGGEWMVQTKVGNAILDSIQMGETIDGKLTGKTLSVYDAHDFDPKTGKVELKKGYVYLDKEGGIVADQQQEQRLIHNRIRETNKRIHGNYRPIDKVWIEKYWWGQLAMQFHKWIVPYFRARFREGKWDENLGGGMYVEGRWRSAWALIKMIKDTRSLIDGWANLTDHQKANVKKDAADLVYLATMIALGVVLKAVADGIPDDDPYVKKFVHYLQYEFGGIHSRAFQEVALSVPGINAAASYQLVKSPVAMTNTLRNFSELLMNTLELPFIDEETARYQRGVFKGEYKVMKNLRDVIPILNNVNKFDMLENQTNFYIK